ncbi:MAG: carbohydrate ABC transporter permease [Candidatus Izemoplasmatales bacterium]|jgi:multiple sugar transport system permease protein|nr:sugar ABC transporter permease [Acholeplasmataceae bacterium]
MEKKNNWRAWLYLAPMLILMIVFIFYPLVNAFVISFYKGYQPLLNQRYAGLTFNNYTFVWNQYYFKAALKNTFVLAFISVPLSIILSLLIAVALNSIPKVKAFFQTVFFLPYVTNGIAVGMAFAVIFHKNHGLFNAFLSWFGIEPYDWIGSTATWGRQMTALLIFTIWDSLAFKILVFASGLTNIDKQYYDAAKIDAATRSTVFKRITVPLLSPLILYISITSMIGALKAYNSVIGLFGESLGGKPRDMITIVAFVYQYRAQYFNIGYYSYAAAAAVTLFVITLVFSGLQAIISRKRVHY